MDAMVVHVTDVEAGQAIKELQAAAAAAAAAQTPAAAAATPAAAAADVDKDDDDDKFSDDVTKTAAAAEQDECSDVDWNKVDGPGEAAEAADCQDDGADIYIYIYI